MSPLESKIRTHIRDQGSLPVADYMALCLAHPEHGYYMTRDPLGRAGDFITAPEISQMFGELIGLWAAAVWQQMGEPAPVRLVELGPGRGTLMMDVLRAAYALPAFRAALKVHLVETSPVLQHRQRETLGAVTLPLAWHQTIEDVPEGAVIVLANEFFDALPIHQAVKGDDGWHERVVIINEGGHLAFAAAPTPSLPIAARVPAKLDERAPPGSIFEWRCTDMPRALATRVAAGGAALIIDYGHMESGLGDTLQAIRGQRFAAVLDAPGEADLTAHVDFAALRSIAERAGASAFGPITQGELLHELGIDRRAARLKAAAPSQAAALDAAVARLTAVGPMGMGSLFKALALSDRDLGRPPGFD